MNCKHCNAPLKPGAKFCTQCGTKVEYSEVKTDDIHAVKSGDLDTSKNRLFWNIQPGQVARVISQKELEQYSNIKGVTVSEGTTAFIRANGVTIAALAGGTYDLVDSRLKLSTLISEGTSRVWQFLTNLFHSKKEKETTEKTSEEIYDEQQKALLEYARSGASFSILILLDRPFPLIFGGKQNTPDDYVHLIPMNVRTKHLDIQCSLNAYFRIADMQQFVLHFLTDKQYINTNVLVHELSDIVRSIIQEFLEDKDLEGSRLSAEQRNALKAQFATMPASDLFGLEVVRIVELTAANEDLARFDALCSEMYLSERELDNLRRTNDFKNRLADVNNQQRLNEARNEVDLQRELDAINKDELLRQDELDKFVMLFNSERRLREAQNETEQQAALQDLYKSGLIREEEVAELEHQIETKKYQRGQMLSMMQLKDGIEFERVRLEGQASLVEDKVRQQLNLQQIEAEYKDSRFYKELEKQRATADSILDIEQRKSDMAFEDEKRRRELDRQDNKDQFDQFREMAEMKRRMEADQREHERTMQSEQLKHDENMESIKYEHASNMTAEQLLALNGGDAAVAYAQSLGARNSAEQERAASERLNDVQERHNQQLFDLLKGSMGINSQMKQEAEAEKDRRMQEQQQRIDSQERRSDRAFDTALNYTTRDNAYRNPAPQQQPIMAQPVVTQPVVVQTQQPVAPQPEAKTVGAHGTITCPECGTVVAADERFCPECGASI